MKKILLVSSLFIFILIQIINIVCNVNYKWYFIIIELLLIVLIILGIAFYSILKYKKIVVNFNNKKYDYVIKNKIIFFPKKSEILNYYYYMKAMAYLENGEYKNFNFYVDKIDHQNLLLTKYYLKIIYSILNKDVVGKKEYEEKYNKCSFKDIQLKNYYDKVLMLLDKNNFTTEESEFIDSINFGNIKVLVKK